MEVEKFWVLKSGRGFKLDKISGELLLARRVFGLNEHNGKCLARCPFKAFKI